jgi:hypothetical protein
MVSGMTDTSAPSDRWFLSAVRTITRGPRSGAFEARSSGRRTERGIVVHVYRLPMIATGVATWPLRLLEGRLGKGDELLVVARRNA